MSAAQVLKRAFRSINARRRCLVLIIGVSLSLAANGTAVAQGVVFVEGDKVGIGVDPTTLPLPVLLNLKGSASLDALVKVHNTAPTGFSGLEFHNTAGAPGFFFGVDNTNNSTRLNSFNDFPFLLMTNNVERIRLTPQGAVGIHRANPVHPLQVGTNAGNGNGAHLTAAGVWTNGSSRENKEHIYSLDYAAASGALATLEPVRYKGRDSNDGEEYLGFIAEDVPALVAMNDRKGLSAMDFVAVLTKVVQEQQRALTALSARVAELEGTTTAGPAELERCQAPPERR